MKRFKMEENGSSLSMEDMQEKVALMEQFAVGILAAFNQQTESHKETLENITVLSMKIQELSQNGDEVQQLMQEMVQGGYSGGGEASPTSGGVAVDREQMTQLMDEHIDRLDFARIMKGHTTRIFQEVEKRFIEKYPPASVKKKKQMPKVIAATVAICILIFLGGWGVFVNIKEKPYYQLIIPAGGKIKWKEANESEPRMITVSNNYFVPLAHYKSEKYLFYTYDKNGIPILDATGKPVTYYIYAKEITDKNMTVINLGIPNE